MCRHEVLSLCDARLCGITWSPCSAFDRSTSLSLDDVDWSRFPRRNTLPNIFGQLINFHDVEGGTGCSIADGPTTQIRVICCFVTSFLVSVLQIYFQFDTDHFSLMVFRLQRISRHFRPSWHFCSHFWSTSQDWKWNANYAVSLAPAIVGFPTPY